MKFKTEKHEIRKVNFLTKVASILFGIFLTSAIFALSINFSKDFGLWLGLAVNALLIFLLFKYSDRFPKFKYIVYGSLGCIIGVTLITFVGLSFLTSSLEGF